MAQAPDGEDPRGKTLAALADRTAHVVVVGLGNAGLPVACGFASAGYRVTGVELDPRKVALVNEGIDPNRDPDPELGAALRDAHAVGRLRAVATPAEAGPGDAIVIVVQTPVGADHLPDHSALRSALRDVAPLIRPGVLVVVESTLAPGTMRGVVAPELRQATGLEPGRDFALAHVPERLMPGRSLRNIRTHARVLGAWVPADAELALALYRHVVRAEIDVVDVVTAEIVKTAENAYRDVQIAFANELALISDALGADVWRIRELVNKVPRRDVHEPGPGVGGHCIPKDPWLLAAGAPERSRLLPAARGVNDSMAAHTAALALEILKRLGVSPGSARVALLGLSYLAGSPDRRNAPSARVEELLRGAGVGELRLHDPLIPEHAGALEELVSGADLAVLLVGHDAYRKADWPELAKVMRRPVVLDGRNVLGHDPAGLLRVPLGASGPALSRLATERPVGTTP